MKTLPRMLLASAIVWSAGCATTSTAPATEAIRLGDVRIERIAGGTRLTNQGSVGLAYALWNPQFLGLMAVCAESSSACLRLAPSASVDVRDSEIVGATEGDTSPYSVRIWGVVTNSSGQPSATEVMATIINRS